MFISLTLTLEKSIQDLILIRKINKVIKKVNNK